jgi:zinc protease
LSWELEAEARFGASLMARRFRWPSGLRLVHVHDPAAPIISYQSWLGVGSSDEEVGRTGIAHLFEHLMFNQTESIPYGELDRMIERTGGDTNAATWVDWTFYTDNVPASELELVARIEAERLQHLLLDDEQLESEREVVMNERIMRVDDDPDGFVDEQLFALAFTEHPYHWPTLGWMPDIRGLDKPTVHAFYRQHYAPDNLCIVVVGDVSEAVILDRIAHHYGDIPGAGRVRATHAAEPEPTGERRARFTKPVAADRLAIGYRSPAMADPDWAVMEVIAGVLVDAGPSARLHRRLVVDTEIAASVDASLTPFRDPGLLQLFVSLDTGHPAERALELVDQEIARLAREPMPAVELDKIRNGIETDFWGTLATMEGKAEALGHYELTLGDFRELFTMADRLAQVTADDVCRVAERYLVPERRCVIVAEPETPE